MIGAAVLSLALFASCTMPVISTRERVLASSQTQDQDVEFTIKNLSPAGYSTVKGVLNGDTAEHLKVPDNRKKYKYCWVENKNILPNDGASEWKELPEVTGEGSIQSSTAVILFPGAKPDKYLVIKKVSGGGEGVKFQSNVKYGREKYNAAPIITDLKNNQYQITFDTATDTGFEYRIKSDAETKTEYDKTDWTKATSNATDKITVENTTTFYLRRHATEHNLASEPKTVTIKNRSAEEKIDLNTLKDNSKLSFQLQDNGVLISGLQKLEGKKSDLTYVSETSTSSGEDTPITIPYGTNQSDTFSLPNQDRVVIKSDGITILTFAFSKMQFENPRIKQENKDKKIIGLDKNTSYEFKKEGDSNYQDVNSGATTLTVGSYGTYHIRIKGSEKNVTIGDSPSILLYLPSEPLTVVVTDKDPAPALPPLIYYPDLFEPQVNGEEAKKAEETKKEEEAKKAEEAKQAEETKKAEETKQAEEAKKAEETKQTEEMKKPVLQSVQAKKKTGATVSSEKIEAVLNADSGKLTVTTKNAEVSLSKEVLDAVFGFEAEPLKVSVKTEVLKKDTKEERTIAKNKSQLVSKNVYHLSVKVGKDSLNDYDLQGGKLVVTLKTNLKTAPKKLYAMNLATGKKVKASFKAGKVSFKSDIEGKFVLVTK